MENLLVKAATSPFSLLGAAFGGGGEEMSFVSFEPGLSDFPKAETKKLDTLAKALYERPALDLEINGSVDPVADRLPLARTQAGAATQDRFMSGNSPMPANRRFPWKQVELEPKEHERLIRKVYQANIGRLSADAREHQRGRQSGHEQPGGPACRLARNPDGRTRREPVDDARETRPRRWQNQRFHRALAREPAPNRSR